MKKYETVTCEVKEKVAFIKINRPEALNALNGKLISELADLFASIKAENSIEGVILTGEGKAFVAGADISEMKEMEVIEGRDFFIEGQNLMNLIAEIEKPVIGAINGYALGGGCELAMACDIRFASDKAKFGQPEVNLGIIPGFGGTQRLSRLVGPGMAKYLIYSAEMIGADEALRIGLVERVVAHDELIKEATEFMKLILSKSPLGVRMSKVAINKGIEVDLHTGISFEAEAMTAAFSAEDRNEGMDAFLNKRKAEFKKK